MILPNVPCPTTCNGCPCAEWVDYDLCCTVYSDDDGDDNVDDYARQDTKPTWCQAHD